ncbi:hypothetical protein GCM10007972_13470 [Iodidimonas muriae]|uniref:CDP-alcohol phosphatidyltransferase family protein n=1 Tax=Iodidimonas muriae TaxID=261467 RepID=A0ABQ2LEI2_9PROT|nr:CDP-alcohol phosphatidyltransferase family protein [Iodidimonas muriae]GGO10554.1 hypothetical protein GCM10007972_13470 [Iodidimonas muriae]
MTADPMDRTVQDDRVPVEAGETLSHGKAGEIMPYVEIIEAADPVRLFGLSGKERLLRQLSQKPGMLSPVAAGPRLILDADCLYDAPVLEWLLQHPDRAVEADGARGCHASAKLAKAARAWMEGRGAAPAGLEIASPQEIAQAYRSALRKREAPFCLRVSAIGARAAEKRLFQGSYKGVTDVVTKYLWPLPAFHVTRLCARLHLSPNMVTSLSAILVAAAFWLFWIGAFAPGLLAAWGMTFLDTVDGKLARTTLTSSKWGNVFDHGIDLIHPPFWYWAWAHGLVASTGEAAPMWLDPALLVIVGGYVAGRLIEGYFIARFRLELHIWRRFDSFFRLIVSRRNPNLVLLSLALLIATPTTGFLWVALWTVLSLLVHLMQILQAESQHRRAALGSWLDQSPSHPSVEQ